MTDTYTQYTEVMTRIDVAYDQALTASVVSLVDTLNKEDSDALYAALDALKGILTRHEARRIAAQNDS